MVSGNAVIFFGIPVLAPQNVGLTRVFRITNVRVNATAFNGSPGSVSPIVASISISGAASLMIDTATPFVGFVSPGLATFASPSAALSQGSSQSLTPATTLSFAELFNTGFKTRVLAQNDISYAGQNATPGQNGFASQNVPGTRYDSESGLVAPITTVQTAGLADFGTRLKAQFNNVPSGLHLFVSVSNVQNDASPVTPPAVVGGSAANASATGFAQLTVDEISAFNAVAATATANSVPVAEIPVVNGSAVAVWEVINTNPAALENLKFSVYTSYTANPGQNSPAPGTVTANLSFAASPPSFSAASGANASDTLPVPRFIADPNAALDVLTITGGGPTPSLSISKSHSGNFAQGQDGATYTVTVSNAPSAAPSDGSIVTVADTLPSGLIATAMSGNGWSCTLATHACTRSDVLAAGSNYPSITVTVHVGVYATSPQTNHARVSGGGSLPASVDDMTVVTAPVPNPNPPIGSAGLNSIFVTCPAQVTAGSSIACTVGYRMQNGIAVDNLAFRAVVTPNSGAPALTGQVGFGSFVAGAIGDAGGTSNSIAVSWLNLSPPLLQFSSFLGLGSLGFSLPASAVGGQSYTVTILSVSALSSGVPVNFSPGLPAILTVPTAGQPTCQTSIAVTPTLRGEGYTEPVGDIALVCVGGTALPVGSLVPKADITVFYNTSVTSRLFPQTGVSNAISDALLLIDDPGSGIYSPVPGFGTEAPKKICPTPLQGCQQYVSLKSGTAVATDTPQGTTATVPGTNVFQGLVNGNSITFYGVPVLAPVTVGATRIFRITNVRANAVPFWGADVQGATPIQASILVSGASLGIGNSVPSQFSGAEPTVGFVQNGLTASATTAPSLNQCSNQTLTPATTLSFAEQFPTAFKTRINAQANVLYAGQGMPGSGGLPTQDVPGMIYNSESGLVLPLGANQTGGLANFGTRLRAVFNNVPAGVRLFVSVTNVQNSGAPVTPPAIIGGNQGNNTVTAYAQLINSETGQFATASATDIAPGGVPVAEIPISNGTGSAAWEVVNTNPNANETLRFAVYTTYVANSAQNSPPPGTATVNLSYAPAPPSFNASDGAAASDTIPIPRFIADPIIARNLLIITNGACTPSLSISKSHTGNFTQAQSGATYTVTVSNTSASLSTSGLVTVTETVPSGLTLVSMSGSGWTCPGAAANNCTRSDALAVGASYPAITVTVNVAADATSPQVNAVSVSGGGAATANTIDSTIIIPPVLSVAKSHVGRGPSTQSRSPTLPTWRQHTER
jgi:uncharacterized repeat protein (TIGR01451 family)